MHEALLDLLRCPFCGTRLELVENAALVRHDGAIEFGVLGCQCCAFPIVAGIPVLIADDATRGAMHALETGRREEALCALLALDADRTERFTALLPRLDQTTFRETLELLSPDAEGTYFLYRFSDPTFLTAEALVRAVGQQDGALAGPVLDLCGGSGHLTRVLAGLRRPSSASSSFGARVTVVADLHFWKLWLATRFTAPGCPAVCCDAAAPLPFARNLFSMVVLADAFPYIWHKRLCADEMMRLTRPDGILLMPHLHSAHGDNFSAGDTLTPEGYRELFAECQPRLFSEARLFEDLIEHAVVDLTQELSPSELGTEAALTLVACRRNDRFRRHCLPDMLPATGELVVNPLYRVERRDDATVLTLTFPTPEYEEEFGACRRYLPNTVTVDADLGGQIDRATLGARYDELRRRRVLIDAPPHYC
ncbi:MAG: methyltransferase domain-containing protein [Vicinamibacterales bacterium]|jgi:uncharacterized protein YbaR (Trm112 family)|nr:methyltransferase domain-containing protein [Vicinamibacterales bacterium]